MIRRNILITPNCNLQKEMIYPEYDNWQKFESDCICFLTLIKAYQFKQVNGIGWFSVDENILDKYLPNWRLNFVKLVQKRIIMVNPYNNKLNFEDNRVILYDGAMLIDKNKFIQLKNILVELDLIRYGRFHWFKDQKILRKIYNVKSRKNSAETAT